VADPVVIGDLRLETDVTPADWVVASVRDFEYDVGSLVPTSFEAYARLFHPAYRDVPTREEAGTEVTPVIYQGKDTWWRREVRWSEVAAANGRVAHPAMEWISVTGSWRYEHGDTQPGLWDQEPTEGSLPERQLELLVELLHEHTSIPRQCWFAVWEGYGSLPVSPQGIPKVQMTHRPMLLFSGRLSAATSFADEPWYQSPSLWWPEDRAWCVATDVDLMSTFVGASQDCIDELVTNQNLEVLQVSVDQGLTYDTDTVNPQPAVRDS
jgi:hypothetical protein